RPSPSSSTASRSSRPLSGSPRMPFVQLAAGKIRYREAGIKGYAPPLLLIHGAGCSSAVWISTMHRLARSARVVAPDMPGPGRSTGCAASLADWTDSVAATAAALCLGPTILVGHILGGLVAVACALAFPDKVAGLALVASAHSFRVSPRLLAR